MIRWIVPGLLLAILMLAMLPLRIAFDWSGLGDRGVSARTISGTIWSGSISDLRIGRLELGDFDTSLSPVALLGGHGRASFTRPETAMDMPPLAFVLDRSRSGFALANANGDIATGALFAPLPIRSITLAEANAEFENGSCIAASGDVRMAIEQDLLGLTLRNGMSGGMRCDGDALLIPLKGQSGLESLDVRITGDGGYTADFGLASVGEPMASALAAAGFRKDGERMLLRVRGRLD
ncbi:MAG: type II secretion system protein N [Blastomonas sp.]